MPIQNKRNEELYVKITENIIEGNTICSDQKVSLKYMHKTINHSAGKYIKNGVNTNGIETVWLVLKRGVYHHVNNKHLARHVNEFFFKTY